MNPDQLSIDFDKVPDPCEVQWAANVEREREHWTTEAMCIVWACGGREDREWWDSLKNYERNQWLQRYEWERFKLEHMGRPMSPPGLVIGLEEDGIANARKLAEHWAEPLRKAFLEGKPCPIRAAPGYEHILRWAMDIAQLVPGNFNPDPEETEAREDQPEQAL